MQGLLNKLLDRGIPLLYIKRVHNTERYPMQNLLMMLAASGLFYTALSSTLYDMTVTDCNAGIELACKEVNK